MKRNASKTNTFSGGERTVGKRKSRATGATITTAQLEPALREALNLVESARKRAFQSMNEPETGQAIVASLKNFPDKPLADAEHGRPKASQDRGALAVPNHDEFKMAGAGAGNGQLDARFQPVGRTVEKRSLKSTDTCTCTSQNQNTSFIFRLIRKSKYPLEFILK